MVVFSLFFGKLARDPIRRRAVPALQLRRARAVDVLLQALMQSANSLVSNQGLLRKVYFPRLADPDRNGAVGGWSISRSRSWCCLASWRSTTSVSRRPRTLGHPVRRAGVRRGARHRALARCRAQRSLPRRALCRAVPRAVLALRHAGRVSGDTPAGALARGLRAQPHGRRGRRLSLGAPGREDTTGTDDRRSHGGRGPHSHWRASSTSGGWSARSRTSSEHEVRRRRSVPPDSESGTSSAKRPPRTPFATRSPRRSRGGRRASRASATTSRRRRDDGDDANTLWALRDVSFEVASGASARHHRPQRRRQEHAAQDPLPDHRADDGPGAHRTAASDRCSRWAPASIPSSPAARTST